MRIEFTPLLDQKPGTILSLLDRAYAQALKDDPALWEPERSKWAEYDREVFENRGTVGAALFLTRVGGKLAGFGSWDPRGRPRSARIGFNCILPEFRGRGLGQAQLREILRRLREMGVQTVQVRTLDIPFFGPARRMYEACGFREIGRTPWPRANTHNLVDYEIRLEGETRA